MQMNTSATHTPMPWVYEKTDIGVFVDEYSIIPPRGSSGPVALVSSKADAEFIVSAVNAHDDLVEALSKTIIAIDAYAAVSGKSDIGLVTAVRDAKATLNSARAAL